VTQCVDFRTADLDPRVCTLSVCRSLRGGARCEIGLIAGQDRLKGVVDAHAHNKQEAVDTYVQMGVISGSWQTE